VREVEVVYILDERDSHLQTGLGWVGRDEKEASVKGSKRERKKVLKEANVKGRKC